MRTTAIVIALVVAFVCAKRIDTDTSDSGRRVITTSTLSVEITGGGNVPKFTYSNRNDSTRYRVQFQQGYQVQNVSSDFYDRKLPASTISLPSYSWVFSNVVTTNADTADETASFNITSATGQTPSFQFRVHINATSRAIKFDTVVENMRQEWKNNAGGLALCYKLQTQGRDGKDRDEAPEAPERERKVGFGTRAYMSIEPTATDNLNKTISATLRRSNDNMACVLYGKFDNGLVHDPELGVAQSSSAERVALSFFVVACVIITFLMY